jgi:hypothetical protein
MNNSDKNENDILGKYINPERIEKAPEEFTEKIMARIQVERAPSRMPGKIRLSVLVPVISATITVALIVLAIIFSSPSDNAVFSGIMKQFSNLNLAFPKIKMDAISGFSLPAIAVYIATGFLILTLFDTALNKLFHRIGE